MFIPSQVHHTHCRHDCDSQVADTFDLLCWNVHKKNRTHPAFADYISDTFGGAPDFLLLQEAQLDREQGCVLAGYAMEAAANLQIGERYYGVVTAGRYAASEAKAFLSEEREAYWGTHKSLLLSKYRFADGSDLLLVNIHAINFREQGAYCHEKERLYRFLSDYRGALIVAGDFNTWNSARFEKLLSVSESLGLLRVPYEEKVKEMFGLPLDLVFYRGLTLEGYRADDGHGISDHHPLYARFSKKLYF